MIILQTNFGNSLFNKFVNLKKYEYIWSYSEISIVNFYKSVKKIKMLNIVWNFYCVSTTMKDMQECHGLCVCRFLKIRTLTAILKNAQVWCNLQLAYTVIFISKETCPKWREDIFYLWVYIISLYSYYNICILFTKQMFEKYACTWILRNFEYLFKISFVLNEHDEHYYKFFTFILRLIYKNLQLWNWHKLYDFDEKLLFYVKLFI